MPKCPKCITKRYLIVASIICTFQSYRLWKKNAYKKYQSLAFLFLSYSWYPSAKSTSNVREDNRHIYIVLYIHTYTHSYVVMRANNNVLNFLWRSCWCPFFCCFCLDYKNCFIWNWQFFGIENTNKSFIYSAISSSTGCICFRRSRR